MREDGKNGCVSRESSQDPASRRPQRVGDAGERNYHHTGSGHPQPEIRFVLGSPRQQSAGLAPAAEKKVSAPSSGAGPEAIPPHQVPTCGPHLRPARLTSAMSTGARMIFRRSTIRVFYGDVRCAPANSVMASTKPSIVYSLASTVGLNPAFSSVLLVTGPIEAKHTPRSASLA